MVTPEVQQAALIQDKIGWKNMLEGLPAKAWSIAQDRHYRRHGITHRTSRQWMKGLLKRLHALAWGQWEHRNKVMYEPDQKKQQEAKALLQAEIVREVGRGPADLPNRDAHYFHIALVNLLEKPLPSQQAWLVNVTAARHRQAEREGYPVDDISETEDRQRVLDWCQNRRFL